MAYRLAADLVVLTHLGFVLFVVLGGLLVLRWRWLAWIHVPAALWAAWISFANWICPLTPLENWLRRRGGEEGYAGSFIEQYVWPVLYPGSLTHGWRIAIGLFVLLVNAAAYAWVLRRSRPGH